MIWVSAAHPAPGSWRIISGAILSGKFLKNIRISQLQLSVSIPSPGPLATVAACLLQLLLDALAEIFARIAQAMLNG
jgi:hypothetical protein